MARQRGLDSGNSQGVGIPDYVFFGGRPSLGLKSDAGLLDEGFFVVVDLVAMVGLAAGDFETWAGFFNDVDCFDAWRVEVGDILLGASCGPAVGGNILLAFVGFDDELGLLSRVTASWN